MDQNPQKSPDPNIQKWRLASLAMEMGFIIALPLILFGLGGKWLDHRLHLQTPWFTLLGIVLAIASTTVWLTQKLKEYIK
jgi:hypothetical protein